MGDFMDVLRYIGFVCLFFAIVMASYVLMMSKNHSSAYQSLKNKSKKTISIYLKFYSRLISVPVIRGMLLNIRKRLEIYSETDEKLIRKRTIILLLTTVALYMSLLSAFWLITRDAFMFILFAVLVFFIGDTVVEIFIHSIQNRLLLQQIHYLELLRHKYYEQKSVEDANYEACSMLNQKGSFEMYTQAERINDILTASDMEKELEIYYETAPNKYLKMLAGILYITKEYGDTKINGGSVFIRCLACLGSEIKAELYKREKLKYALKSLNFIAIVPLFFLKPLRNWACQSFTMLEKFYSSRAGIVLAITTIILSITSYMILRRLQSFDRNSKLGYVDKTMEQKLYAKGLYRLVDKLVPKECTLKNKKLTELIKNSMAPLNIYTLYTRSLIYGVAAFLFGIGVIIGLNYYTRHAILYMPQMPQGYLGGKLSDEEIIKLQAIADYDREIIISVGLNADDETILKEVSKNDVKDNVEVEACALRIKNKIRQLSVSIFWWWELIICFVLSWFGYCMPILSLKFLAKARKIDMEEEMSQFQTIILMLMHMNRVHVEEILEWMETFSIQFKEPLQKCLSNFSSGQGQALEDLKNDVAFPPFISLVENLQLACEDLGVARAFEELENEMEYNSETRKESNERIVEKRRNLGNVIGFLPIYALMLLYLIIPMIVTGMESLTAFYQQLSGL